MIRGNLPGRLHVPSWLLETDATLVGGRRRINTGFLRKTIARLADIIQNDFLCERFALQEGLMQSLDIRVKLVSILFFIILAGAANAFGILAVLFFTTLMLAWFSRLKLMAFFLRVWFIMPVIILIISIPAATSLFIKGEPVIYLSKHMGLYFSLEGIKLVLKLAFRTGVSISFGYLLVMTTRWSDLTKSLRILKVPALVIAIMDMAYRYIFVLTRISIEMFEARYLRTVGRIRNKDNRKFISDSIAVLFAKSGVIGEEIYEAMVSRAYTGTPVSLNEPKLSRIDFVWIFNITIISAILILLKR